VPLRHDHRAGRPEEEVDEPMAFFCSICGEESTRICVRCTKDTCSNHLCDKCQRCSDCCECELTLSDNGLPAATARSVFPRPEAEPEPQPIKSGFAGDSEKPEPSEPIPNPEPDPAPPEPDPV
jgi:hypothetical protein